MTERVAEDMIVADLAAGEPECGRSVDDAAFEEAQPSTLPYPGLRPFRPDETDIFFGRETALDAMVERLGRTKFLAVLGPSGCGKSSLVRTGLYTTLRLGLLPNAGGRWRIAEAKPGRQPIRNLAKALLKARADRPVDDVDPDPQDVDEIAEHLKRGPRSVIELAEDSMLSDRRNLLLVIDQFEELFRFGDYAGREEAEAFVALLLECARSPLPIHVVITMRSEYLGACSLIPGLAEQISDGMFLTPRMTREECREAIEGPAGARGFDIEPELVARILNDLQAFAPFDNADGIDQAERLSLQADQLPLMQHLLNRMWRNATAERRPGRLVLTQHDHDEAGGLTGALDDHGEELVSALERETPGIEAIVEKVFRALVDGPSVPLAVRCPQPMRNLLAAAGGEDRRAELVRIVDAFRGPDCNFLRTSDAVLDDDTLVDLGHESLIRRWSRLSAWFKAEVEARDMWERLVEDAELREEGRGCLLRDLGLRRVTEWWGRECPTPYLASRYRGDFDKTRAFLAASEAAEGRRNKRWNLARYGLALLALAIIAGLLVWKEVLREQKERLRGQNVELTKARDDAQKHKIDAENQRTAALAASTILHSYIAQQFCSQHPNGSAAYQDCVTDRVALVNENYAATQSALEQQELQAPASGAAGGVVPY